MKKHLACRLAVEALETRWLPSTTPIFLGPPDPVDPPDWLQVESEPNDNLADANALELRVQPIFWAMGPQGPGSETAGSGFMAPWFPWSAGWLGADLTGSLDNTDSGADVDCVTFKTDAALKITVSLEGDAAAAGATIELLDADGNVLSTAQFESSGVEDEFAFATLGYYTAAGGSFYIRVGSAADAAPAAAGSYTLHVSVAPDPWEEHEPNDSIDSANAILMSPGWPYLSGGGEAIGVVNAASDGGAANAMMMPIWWRPGVQHGYVFGTIDSSRIDASTLAVSDQDFFSFDIDGNHTFQVTLFGGLAENGGRITLYDANGQELASDLDPSDGLSLGGTTGDGGTFFVRVDQPVSGSDSAGNDYYLNVDSQRIVNPVEGPDETEPNDTIDQANDLWLSDLGFGDDSQISLRTGSALGIVGGPSQDQDVFRFDVRAGEHVQVGLDGFVCDDQGGIYSSLSAWKAAAHVKVKRGLGLASLLQRFPDLSAGAVTVTIVDADGNKIGTSSDTGEGPGGVVFDAPADGAYFAVVTAPVKGNTDLLHYRLSVFAQGTTGDDAAPGFVKVLRTGQSFDFRDASGDRVHVGFQGLGTATLTFTGTRANGSDIASVVINGAASGNLTIQTKGQAEVGRVVVHSLKRRTRLASSFGQIRIDGDLGALQCDAAVSKITIKGALGALAAAGQHIGQLKAATLDAGLCVSAGVRTMQVQTDISAAAVQAFASWGAETDGQGANLPVLRLPWPSEFAQDMLTAFVGMLEGKRQK